LDESQFGETIMALPPEVTKTIQALDKKIRALEETKKRLMDTFGEPVLSPQNGSNGTAKTNSTPPASTTAPQQFASGAAGVSSTEKLRVFLTTHGPATRKDILDKSGVPDGSISYLLRAGLKDGKIRQREDNKWELIA
jgi:hypothetical protein